MPSWSATKRHNPPSRVQRTATRRAQGLRFLLFRENRQYQTRYPCRQPHDAARRRGFGFRKMRNHLLSGRYAKDSLPTFKSQIMKHTILFSIVFALSTFTTVGASGSPRLRISTIPVGEGYCRTSVNAASFRVSPLTSNDSVQYISYYDPAGYVTIGKRHLDSDKWDLHRTQYKGNVKDAHNVISIGLDGEGERNSFYSRKCNKRGILRNEIQSTNSASGMFYKSQCDK